MVQEKKSRLKATIWTGGFILLFVICLSCNKTQKVVNIVQYKGPAIESDNIETRYSDSSKLKIKLRAPKQLELQNGNRVFPNGVKMEFYGEKGEITSTLSANSGIYYKDENYYNVKG